MFLVLPVECSGQVFHFASVRVSTSGSVLGDSPLSIGYSVPAVDGPVSAASPCHSTGIPTEIKVSCLILTPYRVHTL